jgi:hypothetical protein
MTISTPITTAEKINAAHAAVQAAAAGALEHARHCGELLLWAKKQAQHGGWLRWLRANTTVSERTAQLYMQIATRWDRLTAGENPQHVADLSLRGALRYVSDEEKYRTSCLPPEPLPEPRKALSSAPEEIKRRVYYYVHGLAERLPAEELPQLASLLRDIAAILEQPAAATSCAEFRERGGLTPDYASHRAAYRAGAALAEVTRAQ